MSVGQLNEAIAEFHARSEPPAAAVPVARPALDVERPRPPFAVRRALELVAIAAVLALVGLRVFGGLGAW